MCKFMMAHGHTPPVYRIDPANPPRLESYASDRAFAGLPAFLPITVWYPAQWRVADRRRRRLVLKEVNLLASEYFIQRYRPRVVFLVRHPAAVALSYKTLGWEPDLDWRLHATRQGEALRYALDCLQSYPECRQIQYEELRADPASKLKEVCEFAGLEWGAAAQAEALQREGIGPAGSWRSRVTAEQLKSVREAYGAFDLPWYRSDADW
jgi:hypothetical protein